MPTDDKFDYHPEVLAEDDETVAEQSPRSDGASALRPQERPEREETFCLDTLHEPNH